MNVLVCVRVGTDGLGPFDASAYEEALRLPEAKVTLLSMGSEAVKEPLAELTRLGAAEGVLLCDPLFAGADTLATARTLAAAIRTLKPDLILCGRKTLIGDTGQTPLMTAALLNVPVLCDVMHVQADAKGVHCLTRSEGEQTAPFPCLLTLERTAELRLPRLFSEKRPIRTLCAQDLGLSPESCGIAGSPTRVIDARERQGGERKCVFLKKQDFFKTLAQAKTREAVSVTAPVAAEPLPCVAAVGEAPLAMARTVCAEPLCWHEDDAAALLKRIDENDPDAVLFAGDARGRRLAAQVASARSLGLCADCTSLQTAQGRLLMVRPARSGSVEATVVSNTRPALATVVCASASSKDQIILSCGFGAKDVMAGMERAAQKLGASLAASRKAVDAGAAPYERQVGLSGKTVFPAVYIAVGISGQVHHLVGMERAACVIAVNPDRNAPIFRYADYGFLISAEEWLELF